MMRKLIWAALAWLTAMAPLAGGDVETFQGCRWVPADWADGDSFLVRFPDGEERTLRLYGVDCIEADIADTTDARRLRAQRRYFGISGFGGGHETSIAKAKEIGRAAADEVRNLLRLPFTVITAFADARGDGRFERHYAFVETADGRDLAEELVSRGLARAFGVYRRKSPTVSAAEYRERLKDQEFRAAKSGAGVWAFTNWDALLEERLAERVEEEELALATRNPEPLPESIDPNTAPRDLLMQLPGIGETMANRIIEGREEGIYHEPDDLLRVSGVGKVTLERFQSLLKFPE